RDEYGRPLEGLPLLPAGVLEAEQPLARPDANDVHTERVGQVGFDLAEVLEWVDDLDRGSRRVEPERLAQPVDGLHVHPRDRRCPQVERDLIRLCVVQRASDTLSRVHVMFTPANVIQLTTAS